LIVDFEDDNHTTVSVGVEYGKLLNRRIALFIKPTVGFGSRGTDWGIKVGFRHMFPRAVTFR